MGGRRKAADGKLDVECWCRAEIVRVDPKVIQRRETAECGPGCREKYDAVYGRLPSPTPVVR